MFDETTFLPMRTVEAGLAGTPYILLNLKQRALCIFFRLQIFSSSQKAISAADTWHDYRLKIPFRQMNKIFQSRNVTTGTISQLTVLDSPPMYHRRIRDIEATFIEEGSWRDSDCWYRQTHIVHNPLQLSTLPVTLPRHKPIIDIGASSLAFCSTLDLFTKILFLLLIGHISSRPLECIQNQLRE